MQMEQKLHQGMTSEIKILNTLMTHQGQTHKQLLRFKQVLTVLGEKYQASEVLAQQQQAKITSLEGQLASFSQQVSTLNAKLEEYKQHYDQKLAGSSAAIDTLYKKTADALGAMNAVHAGVQQQLQGIGTPTPPPGIAAQPAR
jgi:predicted RNase H-like nuclease (RuvC/YqgF family)